MNINSVHLTWNSEDIFWAAALDLVEGADENPQLCVVPANTRFLTACVPLSDYDHQFRVRVHDFKELAALEKIAFGEEIRTGIIQCFVKHTPTISKTTETENLDYLHVVHYFASYRAYHVPIAEGQTAESMIEEIKDAMAGFEGPDLPPPVEEGEADPDVHDLDHYRVYDSKGIWLYDSLDDEESEDEEF